MYLLMCNRLIKKIVMKFKNEARNYLNWQFWALIFFSEAF